MQLCSSPTAATVQSPRSPSSADGMLLRHAIVLNWEDVLAPMTMLRDRIGLRASRDAVDNARFLCEQDVYLQQTLLGVEDEMIKLVMAAAAIGPVYILTEKTLAFMEATCAAFFPRLAAYLLQANMGLADRHLYRVQVVAAPKAMKDVNTHQQWRNNVYRTICATNANNRVPPAAALHWAPRNEQVGLIAVGATTRDRDACLGAVQAAAPFVQPKYVTVQGDGGSPLSLEAFYAQLQTLQKYLGTAALHGGAFSMHF